LKISEQLKMNLKETKPIYPRASQPAASGQKAFPQSADMKRIFSVCVFLLMLGVAAAQQSTNNSPDATNSIASRTVEKIKAKAEKGDAIAQYKHWAAITTGVWRGLLRITRRR